MNNKNENLIKELREEVSILRERIAVLEAKQGGLPAAYTTYTPPTLPSWPQPYDITC